MLAYLRAYVRVCAYASVLLFTLLAKSTARGSPLRFYDIVFPYHPAHVTAVVLFLRVVHGAHNARVRGAVFFFSLLTN